MPQIIPVPAPITVAEFATIDTNISSIQVIMDASKIPITTSQKAGMLTIAAIRESEIEDVKTKIVDTIPSAVPNTVVISAFNSNLLYIQSLKTRLSKLMNLTTEFGILLSVAESNAMVDTNAIMDNIRIVGKTDPAVASVDKELTAKYFSKSGTRAIPTRYEILASGVITLHVKTQKTFTNVEKTILSIQRVGGNAADAIRVNPFTGVSIPKLWTNIIVTNLSSTDNGAFEVFIG